MIDNFFKNTNAFTLDQFLSTDKIKTLLEKSEIEGLYHKRCTPNQSMTFGFSKNPLTTLADGCFALNFTFSEKKIPAKQMAQLFLEAEQAYALERGEEFFLTKKMKEQIKEDITFKLMPSMFENITHFQLFYHNKTRQLISNNPTLEQGAVRLLCRLLSSLKLTTLYVSDCQHSLTKTLEECMDQGKDYAIGRFGYSSKLNLATKTTPKAQVKFVEEYDEAQVLELISADYEIELARLSSEGVSFDLTKDFKVRSLTFSLDSEEGEFEDRADYLQAITAYQLNAVANLYADLIKTFEAKSTEYQDA